MSLSKFLESKREIELKTDLEQFEKEFINKNYKDFSYYRSGSNKFRIVAHNSFGTVMSLQNNYSISITTTLELKKHDNKNYAVLFNGVGLNSKITISVLLGILILISIISPKNEIIGPAIVLILAIGWFWLIHRGQEEALQASVIKSIKDINKQYEESNI